MPTAASAGYALEALLLEHMVVGLEEIRVGRVGACVVGNVAGALPHTTVVYAVFMH